MSVPQVDGYAGYERLTAKGDIRLAAAWEVIASLIETANLNSVEL